MTAMMWSREGTMSSSEFPIVDVERYGDIERKHREVARFLEAHDFEALLLRKPANFAWFTCGADSSRAGSSERTAAVFITPEARVVAAGSIDASQLFEQELAAMGFQLKERPWHEPRSLLLEDLSRGRRVAGDAPYHQVPEVSVHLTGLRIPLSPLECGRLREVGAIVAHAVEATCRSFTRGSTEAEVAGELSHRIIKHGAVVERLQVFADGRAGKYPHWSYGEQPIENWGTVAAVARKRGLCAAAARSVAFGRPAQDIVDAHHCATLVQATGMFFSQPEWELAEVWDRAQRIYEKYGHPHEWQHAEQAEIIGYEPCELPVVPRSAFRLAPGMGVHWHPSVGPALVGDTILVAEDDNQTITAGANWPQLQLEIKGATIIRPAILRRGE
ncbi:MAG: M24 family metallopeptidase [Planctomycetaceae bacterium]